MPGNAASARPSWQCRRGSVRVAHCPLLLLSAEPLPEPVSCPAVVQAALRGEGRALCDRVRAGPWRGIRSWPVPPGPCCAAFAAGPTATVPSVHHAVCSGSGSSVGLRLDNQCSDFSPAQFPVWLHMPVPGYKVTLGAGWLFCNHAGTYQLRNSRWDFEGASRAAYT